MTAARILITYEKFASLQMRLPRLLAQAVSDKATVTIVKRLPATVTVDATRAEQLFSELKGIQSQLQVSAPGTETRVLALSSRVQVLAFVAAERFDQVLWLDAADRRSAADSPIGSAISPAFPPYHTTSGTRL